MISIPGSPNRWCDGVSRREFLQIGGLGTAGLALPDLLRARAQGGTSAARGAGIILTRIRWWRCGRGPAGSRGAFRPFTTICGTTMSRRRRLCSQ